LKRLRPFQDALSASKNQAKDVQSANKFGIAVVNANKAIGVNTKLFVGTATDIELFLLFGNKYCGQVRVCVMLWPSCLFKVSFS
jgi:hypothetical protein